MRQIDNYTDKERETLHLKGMTAPRTASERRHAFIEKHGVTGGTLESREAQWYGVYDAQGKLRATFESEPEAYFYIRNRGHVNGGTYKPIVNHADKLAEAGDRLKNAVSDLINEPRTLEIEHYAETALHEWQAALAAYEAAQ